MGIKLRRRSSTKLLAGERNTLLSDCSLLPLLGQCFISTSGFMFRQQVRLFHAQNCVETSDIFTDEFQRQYMQPTHKNSLPPRSYNVTSYHLPNSLLPLSVGSKGVIYL